MSGTIVTRAPTRIDFGGGWTDVPPYSEELGGYVCNIAIARFATVTLTRGASRHPDTPSRVAGKSISDAVARRFHIDDASINVQSDFPIGAGLGGSSAAGVAAVAALAASCGESMPRSTIAELSREIEIADLGIAGGRQDHYASAFGGALGLRFSAGPVEVRNISLGAETRAGIERRCVVAYTGQSRISGDTINAVTEAYRLRDPGVLLALRRMRELAESMADTLAIGDIDTLGELVGEHWSHQRSLHSTIPALLIDDIISQTRDAGAIGGKALGASGGGCVLVIARADRVEQVRAVVRSHAELLDFRLSRDGVERCG